MISEHAQPGDGALLIFFTESAFMGSLGVGVIAVPLNIPNINHTSGSLKKGTESGKLLETVPDTFLLRLLVRAVC